MTIRDRTNPRSRIPRKLGTNPVGLDGGPVVPTMFPSRPAPVTQPPVAGSQLPPVPDGPYVPTTTPMPTTPNNLGPGKYPQYTPQTPAPIAPLPLLPEPTAPVAGTPLPLYPEPAPVPGAPGGVPPGLPQPGNTGVVPPGYGLDFVRQPVPQEMVANQLQQLLQSNSPYMQNATQRGIEYANQRGNVNSSIGAGASRRAALEAALPIAQADAQVWRDANQGNFESASELRRMRTAGQLEDWLSDNNFNREYNGRLAMMPIQSSMDMMAFIAQRASEDPAVWTPDVMSGWMNFFNMWQGDMFSSLLGTDPGGDE